MLAAIVSPPNLILCSCCGYAMSDDDLLFACPECGWYVGDEYDEVEEADAEARAILDWLEGDAVYA